MTDDLTVVNLEDFSAAPNTGQFKYAEWVDEATKVPVDTGLAKSFATYGEALSVSATLRYQIGRQKLPLVVRVKKLTNTVALFRTEVKA